MAHLSEDPNLLSAFAMGKDIHQATAAEVFGLDLESVSTEQRRSAKAINFGLIYGMSAFGLAKQLNIGRKQAAEYIDTYFERYPGVLNYMNSVRSSASDNGYVETDFGRRLYLPEINSKNGMRRQAAERTAINAPMQGTAADIIKLAMISVDAWLEKSNLKSVMIMQVHDELVFEIMDNKIEEFSNIILPIMETANLPMVPLKVNLKVDLGIGNNWAEAH